MKINTRTLVIAAPRAQSRGNANMTDASVNVSSCRRWLGDADGALLSRGKERLQLAMLQPLTAAAGQSQRRAARACPLSSAIADA